MKLGELRTVYVREVRLLCRDQHTLIYSFAIPLFLYPAILFIFFQSMALVKGWQETQVCEVAVVGSGDLDLLEGLLDEDPTIAWYRLSDPGSLASARSRLREGDLDAILELTGSTDGGATRVAWVSFSSAHDASGSAQRRIQALLKRLREEILLERARRLGDPGELERALVIEERDLSSRERRANLVLSQIMPLLLVVILVMGAFYPALDLAAGERERRTLETTLIAPVPRVTIVAGKYLAVVSLALLAFILNLASMSFSFKHILVQLDVQSFSISWKTILVLLVGGFLLAGIISALLLVIAFVARTFKEGQSLMTPVYALLILPISVTLSPSLSLTPLWASVPVINSVLVFREVLQGHFDWPLILVSLLTSVIHVTSAVALATWLISRESFLVGEGSGGGLLARLRRSSR